MIFLAGVRGLLRFRPLRWLAKLAAGRAVHLTARVIASHVMEAIAAMYARGFFIVGMRVAPRAVRRMTDLPDYPTVWQALRVRTRGYRRRHIALLDLPHRVLAGGSLGEVRLRALRAIALRCLAADRYVLGESSAARRS